MSEQLPTFDQVIELLQGVLSGDNQKIQHASKILKKYSKLPDSVGPLVQIIQQNQNAGLRQLASLLLRKNILSVFQQLNETAQNELKTILLARFMEEPVNIIKKQIGYTIGQIAQLTLKQGQWNELYQVLQQQTDKTMEEEKRKNGIKLLGTILDFSGEALKEFFGNFYEFFSASIVDPSKDIRIETVKCLVVLFDNISYMNKQQIEQYKELIPHLLQLIEQLVQEGDEDNCHLILDGFSFLAESKVSILDSHFKTIVEYCCSPSLLLNKNMPFILKETCCDLIYTIAEKHRAVFNKNVELIKKTIETCCILVSTPQNTQELDETNGESIHDTVLWLVLMLTVHLNKKKMFNILLQAITNLINTNDPNQMKTAFLLLAQMSEGCVDLLIRNLSNPIMNDFIPKGLQSQHAEVKGACIKAIGFFAEWLGGAIIEYHATILPEIIKSFNDLNQKVQERAMIALDVFCDSMEDTQIALYLPELIPKMVQVPYLQNISITTKRAAMSCIASCISTAAQNFRNYIPQVYKLVHELILMKQTPENDVLTAEAINALAKIAQHFSKEDQEVHNTVVVPCMEKIYDLLCNYGSYEINEGCFSFFYNLAEALGPQFEQIFDKVIEIALKSAASNEGIEYQKEAGNEFSLGSDSEDEDENPDATHAKVKQGFLDEKAAAIHAIGEFAVACPLKFKNYFERSLSMLETVFDHFHSNVRSQAMICYRDLCFGMVKCSNGGEYPEFKKGVPVETRFDAKIEEVISVDIWTKFLHTIRHDSEPEIVAYTVECLTSLIKKLGPAYIAHNLDDLYAVILDILENRIDCCHVDSEDEEEDEDDTDGMVFEAVTDLVPTIAGALKNGFEQGFQQLFPSMMAYTNLDKDFNNRIQIVGSFAQIFKKCDKVVFKLALPDLLPRLLNFVTEDDDELSRNTTYALGLIVQNGKEFLTQENLQHIMIALKHVFETSEDQACKDNTAASLCRIIVAMPDVVPLDTAIDQILAMAPFTGDEEEEKEVLKTLLFLSENKPEIIQKHLQKTIALFVDGLSKIKPYKIKPALKAQFVLFVQNLANTYKDQVEQTVMQLGEAERNAVIEMLKH